MRLIACTTTGYSASVVLLDAGAGRRPPVWAWEVLDPADAPVPFLSGRPARGVIECARWRVQRLAEGLLRKTPGAPRHIRLREVAA